MEKFNIHDWQAKQRLVEQSNLDKANDSMDSFFKSGKSFKPEQESMSNAAIKALQVAVSDYSLNTILTRLAVVVDLSGQHDEADMIKNLASKLDVVEDPRMDPAIRSDFDDPVMDEQNTTGTGASFNAGTGMGHFGKSKKKRANTSSGDMAYTQKVNEQNDTVFNDLKAKKLPKDVQILADHPLLDKVNTKDEWVALMNALMDHANTINQVSDNIKKATLLAMVQSIQKKNK